MNESSATYACDVCTFIQSIKRPTCEMCQTLNPYFLNETYTSDAAVATALNSLSNDDGIVVCFQCNYINIGNNSQICEGCRMNLYDKNGASKKHHTNLTDAYPSSEYDQKQSNDNENITVTEDIQKPQTTDSQRKAAVAVAVEKGMNDNQLIAYYNRYILLANDERQQKQTSNEEDLHDYINDLFHSLEYKNDQSDGQLTFSTCQICLAENEPMITMKTCGHCVLCVNDFNRYLSVRIRDGDILPWIPCPAESCSVPCHAENIINDGHLTYSELLTFLTTYMLKKLPRNENFITCIHCQKGGFLQFGSPKKEHVTCKICHKKQTIEKGVDGDLDIDFKKMIKTGELRECPTCHQLTLKEKGLCNIIECAKCGIWWNWRTREQGHNGKDLKQRARMHGTLWEPGELSYQQQLERTNPNEFKALLERNGIAYDPNYIRGGWNEQ